MPAAETKQLSPEELRNVLGQQVVSFGPTTQTTVSRNFAVDRARAAYTAYHDSFIPEQLRALSALGVSLRWEDQNETVQQAWIRASTVAASYR